MSEIDNTQALLDALRKVGVTIPDSLPIAVKAKPTTLSAVRELTHWHVTCGCFDTMVDRRDATTEDDALIVAFSPLQAWYSHKAQEVNSIRQASRNEYIDWLKRGVK